MLFFWRKKQNASPSRDIPTVQFDSSLVTPSVRKNLRRDVQRIAEVPKSFHRLLYGVSLESVLRGRDLGYLASELSQMNIKGLTKVRIGEIARFLHNRSTSLIDRERYLKVGFTHAIWCHSGAPCTLNRPGSSNLDIIQDAAHRKASGEPFEIGRGLKVGEDFTWPGWDEGCKCIMRPQMRGFS